MSSFVNKVLLFPYYSVLKIRDTLYKTGKKKSYSFDVPIISIGNVTVGGTGKTPHTEMFIREYLRQGKKVAVISRGYGRKTKQAIVVSERHTHIEVGDEPLQIKRKFPNVTVVVDKNRRQAIENLLNVDEKPDIIILDDAFQYRKIKPSRQIVLIDYNRPVFKDSLLPLGRLRDLPERIGEADTVIITKCPPFMNQWEKEKCLQANRIPADKPTYFTTVKYEEIQPIFPSEANNRFIYSQSVILITGIANGRLLKDYLLTLYTTLYHIEFGDHHKFGKADIGRIENMAERYPRTLILTTEKDAQRLVSNPYLTETIKQRLFYIPISVGFVENESSEGLF
ncbi:MAG: tetraacyldisaccharide 4'-kinase [Bacteroidales bacterium]|nr:tetraacyldisaccharide 4'-kinase [Bacteroidales bacterium]